MTSLKQLIVDTALLSRLQGVEVDVNRSMSTISITNDAGESCFIQDHEADTLVDQFDTLASKPELEDVLFEDIWLFIAYDYLEILM